MERRQFLTRIVQTGAAASVAAVASGDVVGANERIGLAIVGCGTRGMDVARKMRDVHDVRIVAVCDVFEVNAGRAKEWAGSDCEIYRDFRRALDRKDVHAVLVATPDHWHAIPTVLACQAGKDVYVEKPLAHNIKEGRAMVEAARKYDCIVQTGMQHRSADHYRQVARIIQNGELGPVRFVRVWNYVNSYPNGIQGRRRRRDGEVGEERDSRSPRESQVDWDFYLGPAPAVPFDSRRFLNSFRHFYDYAGGFLTDFGTHRLDSVHQVMGVDAPLSASAAGARYELHDGADTPDVLQVTYEYPGFVLSYECNQLNSQGTGGRTPGKKYYRARGPYDRPHGEAFYGTHGTLVSDRIGFEIYPEYEAERTRGREGALRERISRQEVVGEDRTDLHVKNFFECMRSRNWPVADIEIGHRSTTTPHLGNIAYRTGRKIRWNAEREEIIGDTEASELLGRRARPPWDLI